MKQEAPQQRRKPPRESPDLQSEEHVKTDPARVARYFAADAEGGDELARLRLLEAEFDPRTFRYLDAIGVGAGWRCLEVGAGGGSVVRWLCEQVGPEGHVVAADIDPRFLDDVRKPNVEVRRCDITRDEIELGFYDLVHCRFLLMHLDDPADVLRRMAAALRPGGWLVRRRVRLGCHRGSRLRSSPGPGFRLL